MNRTAGIFDGCVLFDFVSCQHTWCGSMVHFCLKDLDRVKVFFFFSLFPSAHYWKALYVVCAIGIHFSCGNWIFLHRQARRLWCVPSFLRPLSNLAAAQDQLSPRLSNGGSVRLRYGPLTAYRWWPHSSSITVWQSVTSRRPQSCTEVKKKKHHQECVLMYFTWKVKQEALRLPPHSRWSQKRQSRTLNFTAAVPTLLI